MNATQVYILSGAQGEGKTKRCIELVQQLKESGKSVGGIVAPGFWDNNTRSAFELVDVSTLKKMPFAQRDCWKNWIKLKGFYFNPSTIEKGKTILKQAVNQNDWIVLDEIGKLDIEGHLWGPIFGELIQIPDKKWILCVRNSFVNDVVEHWHLDKVKVLQIKDGFTEV
ncbi:MAG: hypothetical protein JW857_02330 [Bacteroidales bacterium]|nr:hypothetical protein [Bacteroidales bacterium]